MQIKHYLGNWILAIVFVVSCSKEDEPVTAPLTGAPEITVTTLLSNQEIIWGFDFLPNGNILFTQKTGSLRLFDTTTQSNTLISGLPTNISAAGQGGLLDVAISPDYASSKRKLRLAFV
jgi:glucose/arabinose dehydrogenase